MKGIFPSFTAYSDRLPEQAACDRGYRGAKEAKGVPILIPGTPKMSDSYYKRKKKHDLFCRRAAIGSTIGHVKSDHRMSRNYLKGVVGDAVNLMLSVAAFNFKRAMNAFFDLILKWMERMYKPFILRTCIKLTHTPLVELF